MNTRRRQLYLAHSCPAEEVFEEHSDAGDYVAEMQPEDAAEYIAALLGSLRAIAVNAQFRILSDLLSVAEEEAKLHCRA
ncbi:MAG: hypothetical protein ACLPWS_11590 [Rhodomicrobium sp.]